MLIYKEITNIELTTCIIAFKEIIDETILEC